MMFQQTLVALVVALCAAHVLWRLLPAGGRRRVATAVLRWPVPRAVALRAEALVRAKPGCGGCDGCGKQPLTATAKPADPQVIRIVPLKRR